MNDDSLPRIDLRLLRQFVAVAEELHFRRAAERLAMSQPPLTAAIQRLEEEIGATLVERGRKTVRLTPAGAVLLGEARRLLAAANDALAATRDAAAGKRGRVRLGYVGSAMYGRLPEMIRSFRRDHPDVRIELREMTTVAQIAALRADDLDLAIVIPPLGDAGGLQTTRFEGRTLNRFDPATERNEAIGMSDPIGMVAEHTDGTLIVALGCDLATVGDDGNVRRIATAPHGQEGFRLNDGRLDTEGRLWIGLMDGAFGHGTGILYRYDPDGSWHVMDDGFTLVNGLDWSPTRRTLYVTDSRAPAIYAYAHDPATGKIGPRRQFATFGPDDGFPDGLLVGPDGAIWSTLFNAGAIQRIEPDGRFTRRIELPVSRPTSCAFDRDGATLYVTTARLGLDKAALDREPMAGAILRVVNLT